MAFSWNEIQEQNFKQNLIFLREKQEPLYQKICKLDIEPTVSIDRAKPYPNLYLKGNPYYEMPFMDSLRRDFAALKKDFRMLFFMGFGLGYAYQYYQANQRDETRILHIVIIEPSLTAFYLAMHLYPMANLLQDEKVSFFVGLEVKDLYGAFFEFLSEKRRFYALKATETFVEKGATVHQAAYFERVRKEMEMAGQDVVLAYGNSPEDSLIGLENMFFNRQVIAENQGIKAFKDIFFKKPAIVVATGPSLNKNKHLLKEVADKAVIISVDASFKILMDMGIKPHFITSLERVSQVLSLIDGFSKEEVKDVYFAATPVIQKEVYEAYPGPKAIVYRNFAHFKWLENDKGTLPIKQSAGNMAFSVAQYLGCDPIILVGQDLAYGEDFTTHARGMVYGEKQESSFNQEHIKVKGNLTQTVYTNKWWHMFLKGYEYDVKRYEGRCINATEGGAYIEGTTVMPLKAVIDEYLKEKISIAPLLQEKAAIDAKAAKAFLRKWDKKKRKMNHTLIQMGKALREEEAHMKEQYAYFSSFQGEALKDKKSALRQVLIETEQQRRRIWAIDNDVFQEIIMHVIQSYLIMYEMYFMSVSLESESDVLIEMLRKYVKFYEVHGAMVLEIQERLLRT